MVFGFFDGMYKGYDKVFDILNEIVEVCSLKKVVMIFDLYLFVVLNFKRKWIMYLMLFLDKIEKIS